MNKNTKITLGTLAVVVVAGGGLYSYVCSKINNVEQLINNTMTKMQPELPKGATQKNVLNKGIFNSDGIYTLELNEPDGKSKITVKYQIDHGISSWFSSNYHVTAQTNIQGDIKTNLNYTGNFINSDGFIKSNGDANFTNHYPAMTLVDNEQVEIIKGQIAPTTQTINYNQASGAIQTHSEIPNMTLESNSAQRTLNTITFNNIKYDYDFNRNNPLIANLKVDIQSLKTKLSEMNRFTMTGVSTLNRDRYDFNIGLKIDKIIIPTLKEDNASIDFAYSIKNVDKTTIDYYKGLYDKIKENQKITDQEEQKAKENMKSMLTKGVNLEINKLIAKGSFGLLDIKGVLNIKPDNINTFSLNKNTDITLDVKGDGYIAPMLNMYLANSEFKNLPIDKDKFNLIAKYDNDKLTVNNQDFSDSNTARALHELLLQEDVNFGFMTTLQAAQTWHQYNPASSPLTTDEQVSPTSPTPSVAPESPVHLLPSDSETKI